MSKIRAIRSGGQSGVDRAALDTAKEMEFEICGWCPKGGWAEDYVDPPGILALYPELQETPSERVEQRTVWNVRDSDATLIISPAKSNHSDGTELTETAAKVFKKPHLKIRGSESADDVVRWLMALGDNLILNVGGPRESECEGAYKKTSEILRFVFEAINKK